jgi:hypothetical protein
MPDDYIREQQRQEEARIRSFSVRPVIDLPEQSSQSVSVAPVLLLPCRRNLRLGRASLGMAPPYDQGFALDLSDGLDYHYFILALPFSLAAPRRTAAQIGRPR